MGNKKKHHGIKKKSMQKQRYRKNESIVHSTMATETPHMKPMINMDFLRVHMSNPNPKSVASFTNKQNILTVGDGDFSFSLSLATILGGSCITATSYDTLDELREKYSNAEDNIYSLNGTGAKVYHHIDATKLDKLCNHVGEICIYDKIVFNFPHVGGSTEEDIACNQELLRDFFSSARTILKPKGGEILVTLRNTLFYQSWDIKTQATTSGLLLKRMESFNAKQFIGYTAQRTHPAFRDAPSIDGAFGYVFELNPNHNTINTTNIMKKEIPVSISTSINNLTCTICQIYFTNIKKFNRHVNSSKHARRLNSKKNINQ